MLRILVVDDHAITRDGLRRILADYPDPIEMGEAANGARTLDLVRQERWDLVLLDISLPDKSGLDVLKVIKKECPGLAVIVLSMYPVDQYALRVLKAGGAGYLTKESAAEQLLQAVQKAVSGGSFITAELAQYMAKELTRKSSRPLHEDLSDREFEVLRLLAAGRSPTEIADQLHLSVKTVSTHKTHVLEKLGLDNAADLVRYAIQHGLVQEKP
jgi:DNA-binding NarL/FixJ family response regulator